MARAKHSPVPVSAPADAGAGKDERTPLADPTAPGMRPLWGVVIVLAALYPVAYIVIALLRMGHPFELEWMEGGVVDHIRHILAGRPLYVEPSLEFTPFTYPPLYFYAGALVSKVLGVGFTPLRLLSFVCSLVALGFIFVTVRRDTRRVLTATLAACLFAASYREGGAWFDLARVDSMYVMWMAAGISAVRLDSPWLAGALGGLAFALAALTKQSALFIALPAAVVLLVTDWKRGVAFSAVLGAVAGGATLALDAASGGWYRFYVFDLPQHHPIIGQLLRGFWTSDLLGTFAIALAIGAFRFCVGGRATWRKDALDLTLLVSLILTAYVTKIRVGSFTNLVIPAHLATALAFGWGLGALLDFTGALRERGRTLERFVAVLCLIQFVLCAYKPWRQLPRAADLAAGRQFVESLKRVPGDVWIPSHPYLAEMAGKRAYAHELAITDVLRPGDTPQHQKLMDALRAALRDHRYDLVILDHTGWLKDEAEPYYDHVAQMFGKNEGELFWPLTGYYTRPDFVWTPKRDTTGVAR
jgi:4-amino-4-deoxy-L-arabinose transferase-like glycosyltransferase